MAKKQYRKGKVAEEALRQYFLSLGFFVSRNIQFWFRSYQVTDVDLFLYIKKTSITRERINVDIKRKRTPQAIERIFWTKGLKEVLNFDNCVVATTDKRIDTREFGNLHGVMVIDGKALERIISHYKSPKTILSEEAIISELDSPTIIDNKITWVKLYHLCKQHILINQNFSGFNILFNYAKRALDDLVASHNNSEPALRFLYLCISFMLLAIDYKSSQFAYLGTEERTKALIEGFRYGDGGKRRADEILDSAISLAEHAGCRDIFTRSTLRKEVERQLASFPAESLGAYFSKSDVMKSLFSLARQFHEISFLLIPTKIVELEPELKSIIALFADAYSIDRKKIL